MTACYFVKLICAGALAVIGALLGNMYMMVFGLGQTLLYLFTLSDKTAVQLIPLSWNLLGCVGAVRNAFVYPLLAMRYGTIALEAALMFLLILLQIPDVRRMSREEAPVKRATK